MASMKYKCLCFVLRISLWFIFITYVMYVMHIAHVTHGTEVWSVGRLDERLHIHLFTWMAAWRVGE